MIRRRGRGEEGLKRGVGTPVFVTLSSRPHTAGPVDTQLCVATRHGTKERRGSRRRRLFGGNKGYQAFIIRQRVGRASRVIHDSLENASERGSGSGNRFGNLFAPSHSVQLLPGRNTKSRETAREWSVREFFALLFQPEI